MSDQSADVILARIRAKTLARVNRYLANPDNRKKYNERKRELYSLKKGIPFVPKNAVQQEEPVPAQAPAPRRQNTVHNEEGTASLIQNYGALSDSARVVYLSNLKAISRNFGLSKGGIEALYKKPAKTLELIGKMTKLNGQPFSQNSQKSIIQFFIYVGDKLLHVNQSALDKFRSAFQVAKLDSSDATKARQEIEVVPEWDTLLGRVRQKYGELSKEYIVASIYSQVPMRDNLKNLPIATTNANRQFDNYVHVPRTGNVLFHIATFKTSDKFEPIHAKVSAGLSDLIRRYIQQKQLKAGDPLLGKSPLSSFVKKMNNSVGFEGSISFYRRMSAPELGVNLSNSERVEIANRLQHGVGSQDKYRRKRG